MADSAALLVDDILPHQPMRQWVLSVPFPLRFLFASNPKAMTGALSIVYRAISMHLAHKADLKKACGTNRRSDPDSALWQRAKLKHTFSHVVSGRCVHQGHQETPNAVLESESTIES